MNLLEFATFSAAITVSLCANAQAGMNLVANAGFETNDMTDWTDGSTAGVQSWIVVNGVSGVLPNTGDSFAITNCEGSSCISPTSAGGFISQDLNTIAGQSYTLSFYLSTEDIDLRAPKGTASPTEAAVYWQGVQVFDLPNPVSAPGYAQYTVTGLLATSSIMTLRFNGRADSGFLAMDDVSVTAAVPEPASWASMLVGLAAACLAAPRRACEVLRSWWA
jgi:hypothetical protein